MFLKRKSDAFDAFKTFKAYAENQLNAKIKALQDDKAGEYMSAAFLKSTDDCGIVRRHSTRNRPQQNGVAERANRTMSDHATAMLVQLKLPASFWKLAVSAYVHVWNGLPTAPCPIQLLTLSGTRRSLMLAICAFLAVLHMSSFSRTRGNCWIM